MLSVQMSFTENYLHGHNSVYVCLENIITILTITILLSNETINP